MSTAAVTIKQHDLKPVYLFSFFFLLQILDMTTTLLSFHHGGVELNRDEQLWTVVAVAEYFHSKCLRFRKSDVQQWLEMLAPKARVQ